MGLGLTAASRQRQRPHGPGTKKKSEDIPILSLLHPRLRRLGRIWRANTTRRCTAGWPPEKICSQPCAQLKLCIGIKDFGCLHGSLTLHRGRQTISKRRRRCEATNGGGVHGTSTSFVTLSHFSPFRTRLNFKALQKMHGT